MIREHNDRAWMVHTAEALRRSKKMPPLRRLQARVPREQRKRQSWQDMKAVAKLLTQAFGGQIIVSAKQDAS